MANASPYKYSKAMTSVGNDLNTKYHFLFILELVKNNIKLLSIKYIKMFLQIGAKLIINYEEKKKNYWFIFYF